MRNKHCQRAFWHDYLAPSIYFITINKREDVATFGWLVGDWRAPEGRSDYPDIRRSDIGKVVVRAIKRLPVIIPGVLLYQYKVMPDHVHFLINVKDYLPIHLGHYISKFKNEIRLAVGFSVFDPGFNDQIVMPTRSLDTIYAYIRQNPYRLAVRRGNPRFFERNENIRLNGRRYVGYGNFFLLRNPFKEAVIVHRAYSEKEYEGYKNRWLHVAAAGGVVVSPFIARREKEVRAAVEEIGGRVILIKEKPFPTPPYKPSGRDFHQCAKGELLILAPYDWDEERDGREGSRQACLRMNKLAEYMAGITAGLTVEPKAPPAVTN